MVIEGKVEVNGLVEAFEKSLQEAGYSVLTRLSLVKPVCSIVHMHQAKNLKYLDADIIERYMQEYDEKFYQERIGKKTHYMRGQAINRLMDFLNGRINLNAVSPLCGARTELPEYYENLAQRFLGGNFHPNTFCDIRWVIYTYFRWLTEKGIDHISKADYIYLQKFLVESSAKFSPGTVRNMQIYLRKLYSNLFANGIIGHDYKEFFSIRIHREQKVFEPVSKTDIAKMLQSIDRNTAEGKRNYAIMLLGIVLGLRACDVKKLTLDEIDWIHGEIKILQSKTSVSAILPLTRDVAEALIDYITNARPRANFREVFLRLRAPHSPLKDAGSIGEVYEKCCRVAGVPVSKRFHNLRRTLGTSMISNGISVYDVAQVFCDANVESIKPYLAADAKHLKMCALPFDGIEPEAT